jgi:radical SAM protein with 4Fe4S-binding SPASM domain
MECEQTTRLSDKEYWAQFTNRTIQQRIPLSGTLELTRQCSLNCVHCYLGDQELIRKDRHKELDTRQWLRIIDEIVEAGCLFLLLTGGEPLLRKDFAEIYTYAKQHGLVVTVFSNGTIISDEIIALFKNLPPRAVEITLYGATPKTYEIITRGKGSYERCLTGIEKLLDNGIKLRLKTMLMTLNNHEYFEIEGMAKKYNAEFRLDPALIPFFSGDKTPLDFRVDPKEAVEKEFSDDERCKEWVKLFKRVRNIPESETLYGCGAGRSTFYVDAFGSLQPCMMVHTLKYSLLSGNFLSGWKGTISQITEMKRERDFLCNSCKKRDICGYCPAFFELEKGAANIPSEYLCTLGQYRFKTISDILEKEKSGNGNKTESGKTDL